MRRLGIGFALGFVLVFGTTAAALDITTCGQTIPPGEVGVLANDIVCTPTDYLGVAVERDATLDFNSFSLSGGDNIGVHCRGRACTIVGPGAIENGDWIGVYIEDHVRLTISDVTISDADVGIHGSARREDGTQVIATNVVIQDSRQWALLAKKITADGLTVTGTGPTVWAVYGIKVRGNAIDVSNNGAIGLSARKLKATNLTANGNAGIGVDAALRAVLVDSTLTGNDAGNSGIDLRSERRPRLVNTTCGKSAGPAGDWNVCTND